MRSSNGKKVVVIGVSGGVDSMYLLHQLTRSPILDVVVAHVNYHYRSDSDLDEQIVRDACLRYGIPVFALQAPQYPLTGFEEWARDLRYNFFKTVADGVGAWNVYVAHTANDQAETVLMNRQRGCGLYGEGGMRELTFRDGIRIVRPLIGMTKDEIYESAKMLGIVWREDITNTDTKFKRNSIRASMSSSDVITICKQADHAQVQYDTMLNTAIASYKPVPDGGGFSLLKPNEREVWNTLVHDQLHNNCSMTRIHYELLHSNRPETNVVNLPNGWRADKRKKDRVYFHKAK